MAIHVSLYLYYSCVCIWYFHPRQYTPHTLWKWAWLTALYRWKLRTAIAANFVARVQINWVATSHFAVRCQGLASSWIWHCVILWIGRRVRSIRLSLSPRSADAHRLWRKSCFLSGKSWLGAFAKLWKSTVSFVTSVRPSVRPSAWNISAATGWIFMKYDTQHVLKIYRENSCLIQI
jgi:hypothetical protein